ncbi:conserved hypothetical protein [Bradyrhizobium sp. STM 3843]|uniref:hypothetical protein n=1 Tax=Bradyrhizobium sp. STM 3843 TaxID=551947 RepID=UPI0002403AEF|nr:hypothetical protein [Bradyrhizobium sp. STM 3843]CCE12136.1 conserved hypothetical protein [Bradyrhizobium sp. STM 3843]
MHRYVAQANIDHYLSLLHGGDLTADNRSTITQLLLGEEDKLSRDLEHLEFAESRAAESRDRVNRLRKLRDAFEEGSPDRAQADRVLANVEAIHKLMEQFCHHMRQRVNSRGL